jgi:hypothetical protein
MKIELLTHDFPSILLAARQPPRLSLYQPTHRHHPDNREDPLRFRNLVKELERSLRQKYTDGETRQLLDPFESLAKDEEFWNHTLDGLAVFGTPGFFHVFGLQRTVAELAVVADSFHTKPLWRFLQSAGRYQVLALNLGGIRLFEGNRYALDEIDLALGLPRTVTEARRGGDGSPSDGSLLQAGRKSTPWGGHNRRKGLGSTLERFFRVIDRAVLEHHSQSSELPLVLAALPEHHGLFHRVSRNPFLAAEGITMNPQSASAEELRVRAWQVIEPQYHARLAALGEEFSQALSKDHGSDNLAEVSEAAASGRVATLLIEADRQIPGRLDSISGRIALDHLNHPQVDDLSNDLGDLVLCPCG